MKAAFPRRMFQYVLGFQRSNVKKVATFLTNEKKEVLILFSVFLNFAKKFFPENLKFLGNATSIALHRTKFGEV